MGRTLLCALGCLSRAAFQDSFVQRVVPPAHRSVCATLGLGFLPKPRVGFRGDGESAPQGILPKVFEFLDEAFGGSEHVVERLVLPDWSLGAAKLVGASGRDALDTF